MQTIRDFIIFFTILSLSTYPYFLLAYNTPNQHLNKIISGNESDYEALLAIKSEISTDPDFVLRSWNNSLHFCQWTGVVYGRRHKRVVSLDISSNKLVGTLSPFVGNLSFLHNLVLGNNSFRGNIPHQISRLSRLTTLSLTMNSFEGEIPANLSRCLSLEFLLLSKNKLVGKIPPKVTSLPNLIKFTLSSNNFSGQLEAIGIGNMSTTLQMLLLDTNNLQGSIPNDIGRLENLNVLYLGNNMISGIIPTSIFNLSRMEVLYLTNTKIHGHLPQDLGLHFPRLQSLFISNTSLTGQVPVSLSNLSNLYALDISSNSFEGSFSPNGNNLPYLTVLNMNYAFYMGEEVRDLNFLDTLTNCTNLQKLGLGGNSYVGIFPRSILNLSTSLRILDLQENHISGQLPSGLGKCRDLYGLNLYDNHFKGPIPVDIGTMKSVSLIDISINNFSEEIPSSLGNLTLLSFVNMQYNNLEGSLPKSLGNCEYLQMLALSSNKLSGVMPVELFRASSLLYLLIDQNTLQGPLPFEISKLMDLNYLDVSGNNFLGEIPGSLGLCTSLTIVNMSGNSFDGSIPKSLSLLKSIQRLDFSYNNLSGQIPSYFSNWTFLLSLNLSYNNLEGEVSLSLANTTIVSVVGNRKLCGGALELHLPRCPQVKRSKNRRLSLALIISIVFALIVTVSVAFCFYLFCSSRRRKDAPLELQTTKPFLEVSYQMLLRATNGFSPSNLIGVGGFGSVYKGILRYDDTEMVVAVKVLNLQHQGASKSFIAECKALSNVRHINLLKIIIMCSSIDTQRNDFKALVYEYMPKGSLETWLHSNLVNEEQAGDIHSCSLSLFQRLNIAIDMASALEYLHIGCSNPIIHSDLKPSNILLDDEMTAHLGDFGLAKFLFGASTSNTTNQTSSTQVRGTIGYAAPEYGLGSKISPEGDIYSFGIIVLVMLTSKKPTDQMFNDDITLHDFSKSALFSQDMDIIDHRMLGDTNTLLPKNGGDIKKIECIKALMMVGVQCSLAAPQERMSISNALNTLKSARQNILSREPRN